MNGLQNEGASQLKPQVLQERGDPHQHSDDAEAGLNAEPRPGVKGHVSALMARLLRLTQERELTLLVQVRGTGTASCLHTFVKVKLSREAEMTKAPVVSSAAALLTTLGLSPAMGQDAANGEVAQADVLTMTCSSLNTLDAQMSAGVIHYIAGYSDGQRVALAAAGPATTEIGTGQGGGTEGLPGEAAEQTATDEVMNSEVDTSSADAGVGPTADMSAGSANEPAAGLGISVDQVLAACAEAPDSPASEVIKVARGASQPEVDPQDEDPAAEGAEGQDVGSGNTVVE